MPLSLTFPKTFEKHELTVALDIGFSNKKESCGIAWNEGEETKLAAMKFGAAIDHIFKLALNSKSTALIIEAPLSVLFSEDGNPECRFPSEKNNGWYWGAGILTHGAALVLLKGLYYRSQGTELEISISIYEAFSSNKKTNLCDKHEAELIFDLFPRGATKQIFLPSQCVGINKFYHLEKMNEDQKNNEKLKNSPPPIILEVTEEDRKHAFEKPDRKECKDCKDRNSKIE